jgi:hypothetical protein
MQRSLVNNFLPPSAASWSIHVRQAALPKAQRRPLDGLQIDLPDESTV